MRTVLHIGVEKTGTTALQNGLAASSATLAEAGVLYPETPGATQHYKLALYAMTQGRSSVLSERNSRYRNHHAEWCREVEEWLAAALEPRPGVLVLSSEILAAQLVDTTEIGRLKALLDRWTDEYTVVVYLRRQDRAALSLRATDLRVGADTEDAFGPHPFTPVGFDYDRILGLWAEVFGREAVRPRVYERAVRGDGALMGDFVRAAGLPVNAADIAVPSAAVNAALSGAAQQALLEYNRWCGGRPARDRAELTARQAVVRAVTLAFPGPPPRPAREAAAAYLARYAESNRRVSEEWFGGEPVFDTSVEEYPVVADEVLAPDTARLMAVVGSIAAERAAAEQETRAVERRARRLRKQLVKP